MEKMGEKVLFILKRILKERNITQDELSRALKVSRPTISRLLKSDDINFNSLTQILEYIGYDLHTFYKMVEKETPSQFMFLSEDQEKFLLNNPSCFKLFRCLSQGYSLKQIKSKFRLDDNCLENFLLKLDKIKLIDYGPKNKVRLRFTNMVILRPDGPLDKTITKQVCKQLVNSDNLKSMWNKAFTKFGHLLSFEEMAKIAIKESEIEESFTDVGLLFVSKKTYENFIIDLAKLQDKYYSIARREINFLDNADIIPLSFLTDIRSIHWPDLILKENI